MTARKVVVYIPPLLSPDVAVTAADNSHPVWAKLERRGRRLVARSSITLEDLEELADWATAAIAEPTGPLGKRRRAAFQNVINRAARYAVLEPLGPCHCLAVRWRGQGHNDPPEPVKAPRQKA